MFLYNPSFLIKFMWVPSCMIFPLFITNIHGEQELNLDQAIELFKGIKVQFEPEPQVKENSPEYEAASFDITWSYPLALNTMRNPNYLPTADNEVERRRLLLDTRYGDGDKTNQLIAVTLSNPNTDYPELSPDYNFLSDY